MPDFSDSTSSIDSFHTDEQVPLSGAALRSMEGVEHQGQAQGAAQGDDNSGHQGAMKDENVELFRQFLQFQEHLRMQAQHPAQQSQPPAAIATDSVASSALGGGLRAVQPLKKKETPWPKWDGTAENFGFYATQVEVKVEEDRHLLGNDRSICLGMISTLPESRQPRVAHWFQSVGPRENYNWRLFLAHFRELFEDQQAQQTAGDQLSRMRQGAHQPFESFLHDFEYKLAQCGGSGWADSARIIPLNNAINDPLKRALISVTTLPANDYQNWVATVKQVARRLEAHPSYGARSGSASYTKTWFLEHGGAWHVGGTQGGTQPRLDWEGDSPMTGVNAMTPEAFVAAMRAAAPGMFRGGGGGGSGSNKPRAPWRTPEEFKRLMDQGLCTRCTKSGHFSRACPTHRGPQRPFGPGVNAVGTGTSAPPTGENQPREKQGNFSP